MVYLLLDSVGLAGFFFARLQFQHTRTHMIPYANNYSQLNIESTITKMSSIQIESNINKELKQSQFCDHQYQLRRSIYTQILWKKKKLIRHFFLPKKKTKTGILQSTFSHQQYECRQRRFESSFRLDPFRFVLSLSQTTVFVYVTERKKTYHRHWPRTEKQRRRTISTDMISELCQVQNIF